MQKKILVLKCSPRTGGNTDALANAFAKGAKEAGHQVTEFKVGTMNIHPCIACGKCYTTEDKPCVFNDDMQKIYPALQETDVLAIASPIFYYGFTGQYKVMMDRTHALLSHKKISIGTKKVALLMAAGDSRETMFENCLREVDKIYTHLFKWELLPPVLAPGMNAPGDIKESPKLEKAYNLGKAIDFYTDEVSFKI